MVLLFPVPDKSVVVAVDFIMQPVFIVSAYWPLETKVGRHNQNVL